MKGYRTLILLALLFLAPGFSAVILYTHPSWLHAHLINKGHLMEPAQPFNIVDHDQPKWRLIFWHPHYCRMDCLKKIDELARIRLALGRKLYQVELMVLSEKDIAAADYRLLQTNDVQFTHIEKPQAAQMHLSKTPIVYIASPKQYLILSYSVGQNPADIYQDLKHLITSGSQSG